MAKQKQQGSERVALVGYHDEKVQVEWSVANGIHRESRALPQIADKPSAGFIEAFEALTPFALEILRVKAAAAWKASAKVTKLHVSYDPKSGRRTVSLTVWQPLEFSGCVVNTPGMREKMEPTEIGAGFVSDELMAAVNRVCAEAVLYATGKREQGELFEEGEQPSSSAAPDIAPAEEKQKKRPAAKKGAKPSKRGRRPHPGPKIAH